MSAPDTAEARAFYDAMWTRYAHLDAVSPAAFHRRRLVVDVARRAKPDAGTILDAGCGTGDLLVDLARAFPRATLEGTDVSDASLALTREKLPRAEVASMDLVAPSFDAIEARRLARYDLVVCSEVLEHIADDRLAASRLARLLAPGGAAIVTVPGGRMSRFDVAIGHVRHYRPEALARVLEGAGLEVDRVLAWGFPFHSAYRSMVRVASRFAMGDRSADAGPPSAVSKALGAAYELVGRALLPAFYFNLDRWGEQMVAVARSRK